MASVAAILCALGIVAVIWGGFQRFKAGRLSRAPLVTTGDAASRGAQVAGPKGAISVEGAVACPQPLISPATGTPCLYYELKVTGSWKEGDQKKSKEYLCEKRAAPFAIDDGSGPVKVCADKGGDFEPFEETFKETKKEGLLADLKSAIGRGQPIMFGQFAFQNPPMSKANTFTCTEEVLKVQPRLFALGKQQDDGIGSPSWTSLILSSKSRDQLLGSTLKSSKLSFIGGGGAVGLGAILGVISMLISPATKPAAAPAAPAAVIATPAKTEVAPAPTPTPTATAAPEATEGSAPKSPSTCAKAVRCCQVLASDPSGCTPLLQAPEASCRTALKSFINGVKRVKPSKLSHCR